MTSSYPRGYSKPSFRKQGVVTQDRHAMRSTKKDKEGKKKIGRGGRGVLYFDFGGRLGGLGETKDEHERSGECK